MLESSIQLPQFSLPELECAKLLGTLRCRRGESDWGAVVWEMLSLLCGLLSPHLTALLHTPLPPQLL